MREGLDFLPYKGRGCCSDESCSKFFDPDRVGVNFCCLGWVGSAIFGLGLENFTQKLQIFNILPFGSKISHRVGSNPDWALIYCRSKVCSDRVRAHLYGEPFCSSVTSISSHSFEARELRFATQSQYLKATERTEGIFKIIGFWGLHPEQWHGLKVIFWVFDIKMTSLEFTRESVS